MKKSRLRLIQDGGNPLILVSEAVGLVRSLSLRAWAGYLVGAVPFLLATCFFVSDMARSVDADSRLGGWCLILLLTFAACKWSQVDLVEQMISRLGLKASNPWSLGRAARVVCLQVAVQSTGLLLYPIGLVLALPAGWINAFYQSFYVTGTGTARKDSEAISRAWAHTIRWPGQNHWALFAFSLLAVVLFLNWIVLSFALPYLGKLLVGWETTLSRNPMTAMNTTLLMLEVGLTWLVTDPLHKAIYALRCFRGDSIENGADLRAAAMSFRQRRVGTVAMAMAITVVGCALTFHAPVMAAEAVGHTEGGVSKIQHHEALNRKMDEVLKRDEYRWRIPGEERVKKPGEKSTFWESLWKQVEGALDWVGDLMKAAMNTMESWLRKLFSNSNNATSGSRLTYDWSSPVIVIVVMLLIALACFVGWWLLTNFNRPSSRIAAEGSTSDSPPDLRSDAVTAADLPVSGWWELGAKMLAEREYRLAMRAFHLAALAGLAERRLITLAQFKSNRDYLRELQRRGHALPTLVDGFRSGLGEFEGVWYGDHPASEEKAVLYRDRMRSLSESPMREGGV